MPLPPPTVIKPSFRDILVILKASLTDALSLDPSQVIVTILESEEVPHLASTKDLILRPLDEEPDARVIDGSGRVDNRRTRTLQVVMRTRLNLDQVGSDLDRLTDASLGHIAFEDAVVDNMECLFVIDASGNDLLVHPMRLGPLTATKRDAKSPQDGWVSSSFRAEIMYERNLNLALGY